MIYTCTHCGCTKVYTQQRGPHLGVFCSQCNAWISWAKKGTPIENKVASPTPVVQGQAVKSVCNVPVASATVPSCSAEPPWETGKSTTSAIPPWETERSTPKEVTLKIYGFAEVVTSMGTVKPIPQDTRVVIANGRISIYDIATDELLDSYTVL